MKYSSLGSWQWTHQLGNAHGATAKDITTDSIGNVYITGWTNAGLDNNTHAGASDFFVAKYSSNGIKQWIRQRGTSSIDSPWGIATDSGGNVYVTGFTAGGLDGNINAGSDDLFIIKYDSNGNKK